MDRYLIPKTKLQRLWMKDPAHPNSPYCGLGLHLADGSRQYVEPDGVHIEEPAAKCPVEKAEKRVLASLKVKYLEAKAAFQGIPAAVVYIEIERMESGVSEVTEGKVTYAMQEFGLTFTTQLLEPEWDSCRVTAFDFEKKG